eukprot:TRINITY_DN2046_c0_g1_i9.p2 TRINITY_DN2046_c0_g1~~TRINITY_DN2046_c0_g1_i9.p2  ORF type:complete len:215 (-),score=-18.84 TRINITY_DN2046_c0_g1_i9:460-1104(-)
MYELTNLVQFLTIAKIQSIYKIIVLIIQSVCTESSNVLNLHSQKTDENYNIAYQYLQTLLPRKKTKVTQNMKKLVENYMKYSNSNNPYQMQKSSKLDPLQNHDKMQQRKNKQRALVTTQQSNNLKVVLNDTLKYKFSAIQQLYSLLRFFTLKMYLSMFQFNVHISLKLGITVYLHFHFVFYILIFDYLSNIDENTVLSLQYAPKQIICTKKYFR